jgi:cyanate permease
MMLLRLDIWMLFSQQFFRAAGYIFFATWFPTFLKETRGVSTAMSGALTALPLLAVVVGGMCGGVWIDFLYNRTGSLLISWGIFLAQLGGPSAYVVMIDKAGPNTAPLFGAMNMAGNLGAAICPSVVGGLVAWSDNWNLVLFLFAGIYLAASLCWIFLDPRGSFTDRVEDKSMQA